MNLFSRLPDNVSLEEGAMIEPLSVGVNAVHRARMCPGDQVIVFGAGESNVKKKMVQFL